MVTNRIQSASVVAEKNPEEQGKILSAMNSILDSHPSLEEARKTNVYRVPYKTVVSWVYNN